jgi:hypothetical protein
MLPRKATPIFGKTEGVGNPPVDFCSRAPGGGFAAVLVGSRKVLVAGGAV